jgi:hypothetical protein
VRPSRRTRSSRLFLGVVAGVLLGRAATRADTVASAAPVKLPPATPVAKAGAGHGPPTTSSSVRTAPSPTGPSSDTVPQSWSDPRVIEQLTDDCRFDPDKLPEDLRAKWQGEMDSDGPEVAAMSCEASLEQSCVDDPCYEGPQGAIACTARCAVDCRGCGKACALDCHACKHTCKDRACRVSCATACAACHEECVRKRDRCATGGCQASYKGCWDAMASGWRKNGCADLCKIFSKCADRCFARVSDGKPCDAKCLPKDAHGCDLIAHCPRQSADVIDPVERSRTLGR